MDYICKSYLLCWHVFSLQNLYRILSCIFCYNFRNTARLALQQVVLSSRYPVHSKTTLTSQTIWFSTEISDKRKNSYNHSISLDFRIQLQILVFNRYIVDLLMKQTCFIFNLFSFIPHCFLLHVPSVRFLNFKLFEWGAQSAFKRL